MRNTICLILLGGMLVASLGIRAQSVTDTIPNLRIFNNSGAEELLRLEHEILRKSTYTNGYRLQIIFSTNKEEVNTVKVNCYKKFPQYRCYVEYEAPRYKLLLGDFRSRLDAYHAMMMLLTDYPGAFIVKDRVLLKPL